MNPFVDALLFLLREKHASGNHPDGEAQRHIEAIENAVSGADREYQNAVETERREGEGLVEVLKRTGQVVSKAEVDQLVNTRAAQLTTEQRLLQDYPELSDKKSEFFQATAGVYGELKAQGVPEALAMQMAAAIENAVSGADREYQNAVETERREDENVEGQHAEPPAPVE